MNTQFDNSFARLPAILWSQVDPTPLTEPRLGAEVRTIKEGLGAAITSLSEDEMVRWLNGEIRIAGDQRLATCYAGHQFGVWAGQLGDGRALSFGEVVSPSGERSEVQVKGLGRTPYSRMGDGRAVIRSSVREFLCAEYLHALGVPTTRSLALIVSDTPVRREVTERAALVARVFPSQIRFGHFEYLYHFDLHQELGQLIEYVRATFMPGFPSLAEWFGEVVRRTARLIAHWQAIGFCHGVMNTDNMSILGLTLDYGPFGFLGAFDPGHVCNHSDHEGRYSYQNQPRVGLWNLQCLASCLLPFVGEQELTRCLTQYEPELTKHYRALMANKLGIESDAKTLPLVAELLHALEWHRIDYHFFFSQLGQYEMGKVDSLSGVWSEYPDATAVREWCAQYDLAVPHGSIVNRTALMRSANPRIVLRNHVLQQIIADVEQNKFDGLRRCLAAIENPFSDDAGFPDTLNPYHGADVAVSCSS